MASRFRVEVVFLLVGLGLLAGGIYAYYAIVVRPASWPQVEALIVSSRVVNPKSPTSYSPELVFRLAADDSTRDVRITPSWSSSSYDVVRGHVDQFPAGRRVKVAVNPGNPGDVRYDLGVTMANMIVPGVLALLGLVFTAVGMLASSAGRKTDEFMPPVPSGGGAIRMVPRIFVLVGAIITVVGGLMLRADLAMLRGWPAIEGRVLESKVVSGRSSSRRGGGNTPIYDTAVKFRYAVNGVTYENGTTYGMGTSVRSRAAALAEAYAPGTVHRIWHRPDDPNLIRFDLDSKFSVLFLSTAIIAMGLIFLGLGGLFWKFMGARATSLEDPAFGARLDQE